MTIRRPFLIAIPALLATLGLFPPFTAPRAKAHSYTQGDIVIGHPWTRVANQGGTGAGYLTLRTAGAADRLVSASTPVARTVELHTMIRDGDVMRMRPVEDIAVPPGQTVTLAPGGLHIMLIGLTQPLELGSRVPLTLRFERAGEVTVELAVQRAGAPAAAHAH